MPSGAMPAIRCSPLTPAPVPISTTERAPMAAARKVSAAAPPDPIGTQPRSAARPRAASTTSSSGTKNSA